MPVLGLANSVTVPIATVAADYTLALADAGSTLKVTSASAQVTTIPPNSSVAFDIGTEIAVMQYGAGQVTINAGAGVTLRSPTGARSARQYGTAFLLKIGTDEWVVAGDTAL